MVLIGTPVYNRCVRSSYLRELAPEVVAIGDGSAQEDTACETWVPCDAEYHYMNNLIADNCIYRTGGRGSI